MRFRVWTCWTSYNELYELKSVKVFTLALKFTMMILVITKSTGEQSVPFNRFPRQIRTTLNMFSLMLAPVLYSRWLLPICPTILAPSPDHSPEHTSM